MNRYQDYQIKAQDEIAWQGRKRDIPMNKDYLYLLMFLIPWLFICYLGFTGKIEGWYAWLFIFGPPIFVIGNEL